jgi:poly-gamma-glutamate synthesis protein (capsule biosynthesis protein)
MIESVPVFYSLGNYIFDQYFSEEVQQGLLLSFEFKPEPRIVLHPVESLTSLSQPRLASRDSKAVALYELSKKANSTELATAIRRGVITVPLDFASTPKVAMMTE